MFSKELHERIKNYCMEQFPREACGFIIGNEFIPKDNVHEDPENHFRIRPNEWPKKELIQGVVHSHTKGQEAPSKRDMEQQIATAVPWGIVVTDKETVSEPIWWGPGVKIPPLVGRPFRWGPSGSDGKGDCYALIRDYFRLHKGVLLDEFPREDDPDHGDRAGNLYLTNFESQGFVKIDQKDIKPGDCFLAQIRSRQGVPNHAGVFVEDLKILHHLQNFLSRHDNPSVYLRTMTHFLRYEGRPL